MANIATARIKREFKEVVKSEEVGPPSESDSTRESGTGVVRKYPPPVTLPSVLSAVCIEQN